VVGLAVVDFCFNVEELPQLAEKYIASGAGMVGGGGAANAAVAVTRLGGNARLAARVGNDLFGNIIIEQLQKDGVDCSLVQVTANARSSFSSVLINHQGERQIVNFRGAGLSDDSSALHSLRVDAVLSDTRWHAGTTAALQLAQRLGVPGVIDVEAPINYEALKLASHCAFSKQGLQALTGIGNPQHALQAARSHCSGFICVTDGEHGVYYLDGDVVRHVPAYAVTVADTLGAGDVWHGAFSYALAEQQTEYDAMCFASAAAALKCTRKGGGREAPSREQVNQLIQQSDKP
jgi:sulfofructose kinase